MGSSLLQRQTVKQLDRLYGCHAVQENVRPEWLRGPNGHLLELDVFVPSAKIAIEVQGPQHYRFSEHFHGDVAGFEYRQKCDSLKRVICAKRGVTLYEIASHSDLADLLVKLKRKTLPPDPKYIESVRQSEYERNEDHIRWLTREYRQKLQMAEREFNRLNALRIPRELRSFETEQDFLRAESRLFKRRDQLRRAEERARRGQFRCSDKMKSLGRQFAV